ncbi:hypothetical protein [Methylobacter sp. BBA5.1]|uniref:hypothetical protein n=1 Tax=Methylobacter sp. BBA5.1 TaxID=1495064 RepID=UPI00055CE6F0|nr:hypothetical protein [Methylobacter sp. BBA5.1]
MLKKELMETRAYHEICSKPSSFSRQEIEQTLAALEKVESNKMGLISDTLKSKPAEKPAQHRGSKETDYFLVQITIEDAEKIVEALGTLEAQSVSPEGHTTREASYYASLLDRWLNYVESL